MDNLLSPEYEGLSNPARTLIGSGHGPNVIVLIDNQCLSRDSFSRFLLASSGDDVSIEAFQNLDEMQSASIPLPSIVILCTHRDTEALSNELIAVAPHLPTKMMIISDDRPSAFKPVLKTAMRSGISGFVSTADTSITAMNAIVSFVMSGGTFLPRELLIENFQPSAEKPKSTTALCGLTPRQQDVFSLLTQGKANKIIAYELGLSPSTVKVHVRAIMRATRSTNRTEAVFKSNHLGMSSL
jgi:DNA-binding NarL/FixJ family response regulator